MSDVVRNPGDRFSHNEAPIVSGDIVLAKYTLDKQWYRARIKNVILTNDDEDIGAVKVEVVYIDYGNSEVIGLDR